MIERTQMPLMREFALRTPDNLNGPAQLEQLLHSCPRPFVLINERELSVLRRGLTKEGWKRNIFLQPAPRSHGLYVGAGMLSVANIALESPVTFPGKSVTAHGLRCDCGADLAIDTQSESFLSYTCPSCSTKLEGEAFQSVFKAIRHIELAGYAMALALSYGIEKDRAYADKASEILLKYAEHYPEIQDESIAQACFANPICEAGWITALAQAYDLIYYSRSLVDTERVFIENRLLLPAANAFLKIKSEPTEEIWLTCAAGVLGAATKNSDICWKALEAYTSLVRDHLSHEGMWPGNSKSCRFYPISAMTHFAEAYYRFGIDLFSWNPSPGKGLKIMFDALAKFMYPSFEMVTFSDCHYKSYVPLDLFEVAARRWNDPVYTSILKRGYRMKNPFDPEFDKYSSLFTRTGFYAFLFGRDLPGRSSAISSSSGDFPAFGVYVLRNEGSLMATLHYSPYGTHPTSHRLGFTLCANDKVIVPSQGVPFDKQSSDTNTCNTVIIDGKIAENNENVRIVSQVRGGTIHLVEGSAAMCAGDVSHTRRALLAGDLFLVMDKLESRDKHSYEWVMNSNCDLEPMEDTQSRDTFMAKLISGDTAVASGFWSEDKVSIVADARGIGKHRGAFFSAGINACNAQFIVAFAPYSTGNPVKLERDGNVIHTVSDKDEYYVVLQDASGSSQLMQSDAKVAVAGFKNGRATFLGLIGGSWLKMDGEEWLRCPAKVECVEISLLDKRVIVKYQSDTAGMVRLRTTARSMRVNGQKAAASTADGVAMLRILPSMLAGEEAYI